MHLTAVNHVSPQLSTDQKVHHPEVLDGLETGQSLEKVIRSTIH